NSIRHKKWPGVVAISAVFIANLYAPMITCAVTPNGLVSTIITTLISVITTTSIGKHWHHWQHYICKNDSKSHQSSNNSMLQFLCHTTSVSAHQLLKIGLPRNTSVVYESIVLYCIHV